MTAWLDRAVVSSILVASLSCSPTAPFAPEAPEPERTLEPAAIVTILDLGTLWTNAVARGINDLGHVVGSSNTGELSQSHAFIWQNGVMAELGLGGFLSVASDINNAGQVVGSHIPAQFSAGRAFLWENGLLTELGGPFSGAFAINEAGHVVGFERTTETVQSAFLWQDGAAIDLGTLGGTISAATDINDAGLVVGWSRLAGDSVLRAFTWQGGIMTDLGAPGGLSSGALGVNNLGQIVGWYQDSDRRLRAVLWENGAVIDLGTLGGAQSIARAINDAGQIVGWSEISSADHAAVRHAFVWQNGVITDLGTLGGNFSDALAINDMGQMVGVSTLADGTHNGHATMWIIGLETEALADLIEGIRSLEALGSLTQDEANSLIAKLEAAAKLIERESYKAAAGLVLAFVHQLEALVQSGRLDELDAQPLIDAAQALADQLHASHP